MEDEKELQKAINILLWGSKGYQAPQEQLPLDFSIEKVLTFLKQKKEYEITDEI